MEAPPDPRDRGVVPLARSGLGGRHRRQLARRLGAGMRRPVRAAERAGGGRTAGNGFDAIFEDLAALDDGVALSWTTSDRSMAIDPGERALLVQLYRELIGSAEGPVLPFPVELVAGEFEAPERAEPAEVVPLDALRLRRAAREAAAQESSGAQ